MKDRPPIATGLTSLRLAPEPELCGRAPGIAILVLWSLVSQMRPAAPGRRERKASKPLLCCPGRGAPSPAMEPPTTREEETGRKVDLSLSS